MWSDGPGESRGPGKVPGHDRADQHVSFATSVDGLKWSAIGDMTGAPDAGYGWIARGFWIREGMLLALASRYKAPGYQGEGLSLHAFTLASSEPPQWRHLGLVFTAMGYLVGGRHVDYPHVIEHEGALLVAFATAKSTVEVLKIRVADLAMLEKAQQAKRVN